MKENCWKCDKSVSVEEGHDKRVFCEECNKIYLEERRNMVKQYVDLKIRVMFENAVRIMEKSDCYVNDYRSSIEKTYCECIEKPEKYASTEEIIASIVLNEMGYEFLNNYTVSRYRVDFFIPEINVCLEVDGERHQHSGKYDNQRDIDIRRELGNEWEIIRIPTKHIHEHPHRLVDAIEGMYQYRKKLRADNNGLIPDWYSKREREHYSSILPDKVIRKRKL